MARHNFWFKWIRFFLRFQKWITLIFYRWIIEEYEIILLLLFFSSAWILGSFHKCVDAPCIQAYGKKKNYFIFSYGTVEIHRISTCDTFFKKKKKSSPMKWKNWVLSLKKTKVYFISSKISVFLQIFNFYWKKVPENPLL